jgi:hypothetical protein
VGVWEFFVGVGTSSRLTEGISGSCVTHQRMIPDCDQITEFRRIKSAVRKSRDLDQ